MQINIKMKKLNIFVLGMIFLLAFQVSFISSEGYLNFCDNPSVDCGEGLTIDGSSSIVLDEEGNFLSAENEDAKIVFNKGQKNEIIIEGRGFKISPSGEISIFEDSSVFINGKSFENINSGKIILDQSEGDISIASFYVGETSVYEINGLTFRAGKGERIYYDKSMKVYELGKDSKILDVGPLVLEEEFSVSGDDLNFFDEYTVSGLGNFNKNGFSLEKGFANLQGFEFDASASEDPILISKFLAEDKTLLKSVSNLVVYGEHFESPKKLEIYSSENGEIFFKALKGNEFFEMGEVGKLDFIVSSGDSLEIKKFSLKSPEIIHKGDSGETRILNDGVNLNLYEGKIYNFEETIHLNDILEDRYAPVPFIFSSEEDLRSRSYEFSSIGNIRVLDSRGNTISYKTNRLYEGLFYSGFSHNQIKDIALSIKNSSIPNLDSFNVNLLSDCLGGVSYRDFDKDLAIEVIKNSILIREDEEIFHDFELILESFDEYSFTDEQISEFILTTSSNSKESGNLEYLSPCLYGDYLKDSLENVKDFDMFLDYSNFFMDSNFKEESWVYDSLFARGLREYDGTNFEDIKTGILVSEKYGLKDNVVGGLDEFYFKDIKDKEDLAVSYANSLNDLFLNEAEKKNYYSLRGISSSLGGQINSFHDSEGVLERSDKIRDIISNNLNLESKYYLISLAKDDLYPSTFGKLYDSLPENSIEQIRELDPNKNLWLDFSLELASRGKLNEFLEEDSTFFRETIKDGFGDEDIFKNTVYLTDTFKEYYENPSYESEKTYFEDFLIDKYKNSENSLESASYAYLLKLNENPLNEEFKEISESLPEIPEISFPKRYSEKKELSAKMYFYDSEEWFGITRDQYSSKNNIYKMNIIKETPNEIVLTKQINGKIVTISLELVPEEATPKNYEILQGDEYQIVSHRGHSYHLDQTFNSPSESDKILFLGSCSSYYDVPDLQKTWPNSYIISDKDTGEGAVNNLAIYKLLENIAQGKTNWDELKQGIPQDKNLVFPDEYSQLVRRYYDLYFNPEKD